jgi:cardiolipin synthase
MHRRVATRVAVTALSSALLLASCGSATSPIPDRGAARRSRPARGAVHAGTLSVLPDDGREPYFEAIDAAKHDIRIEICVLEDPQVLEHLQAALHRGVRVRAIVDRGKYDALPSERASLSQYLSTSGGVLHVSNPVFPRSFPKIILVDSRMFVYGSACLDQTTFQQYRDFAQVSTDPANLRLLHRLFETDWAHSAAPGRNASAFSPTPPISGRDLIVAPVNASARLVNLYERARRTLDVYTEIVGNPTLEGALVAAVGRGVRVRLIAPALVNGATPDAQQLQVSSLAALATAGVHVHVSGPEQNAQLPYMHARAAVVDGAVAYLGSVSLSPDSATMNREMGLIQRRTAAVRKLAAQFASDFARRTKVFSPNRV